MATDEVTLKELMDKQFGFINSQLFDMKLQANDFDKKLDTMNQNLLDAKINNAEHFFKCPLNEVVAKLDVKVELYKKETDVKYQDLNFFLRHPYLIFVGVAVICVLTIGFISKGYNDLNATIGKTNAAIEQTNKAIAPIVEQERRSIIKK